MKKIISLILALVMVMGLAVTASAAETGSITITPPTGVETTTYNIYKVFDAVGNGTNISYTLVDGKTTAPEGFTVDTAGNVTYTGSSTTGELTAPDIAAIAAYVKNDSPVATVNVTDGTPTAATGLANGYYYITTGNGAVVAIDSTNPNASVTDKNVVPTLEKKIVDNKGTTDTADDELVDTITADRNGKITFQITVTIPQNATGTITIHDNMGDGLNPSTSTSNPTISNGQNPGFCGCDKEWTLNAENYRGQKITITYDATVGLDAATGVALSNEAWLDYGPYTYPHDVVEVYTYQIDVFKYTGEAKTGLAGAGFKLKNADGLYYTNTYGIVSWTETGTEYTTSEENDYTVSFVGIANGTYTLEESTVPAGYNKANDREIKVEDANWTGNSKVEVENKSGSELPSTGGMGTTLFYVLGGLMMTGAAVLLITKKRLA